MKIRNGFISNSSSCSFCINKSDLNEFQEYIVRNWLDIFCKVYAKNYKLELNFNYIIEPMPYDYWSGPHMIYGIKKYDIIEHPDKFEFNGYDDFNLSNLFNEIGIKAEEPFREYYVDPDDDDFFLNYS
jgi:hypothetical protein